MKNIKFILFAILASFSSLVFAHSGHGDHSAIYASGQSHPSLGNEHLLVITLVLAVYFTMKWLKNK